MCREGMVVCIDTVLRGYGGEPLGPTRLHHGEAQELGGEDQRAE